jgi:hypothetical protein
MSSNQQSANATFLLNRVIARDRMIAVIGESQTDFFSRSQQSAKATFLLNRVIAVIGD